MARKTKVFRVKMSWDDEESNETTVIEFLDYILSDQVDRYGEDIKYCDTWACSRKHNAVKIDQTDKAINCDV